MMRAGTLAAILPQQARVDPMRIKWLLAMAVIAGLVGTGVAFSQHPSQPAATHDRESQDHLQARMEQDEGAMGEADRQVGELQQGGR